MDWIEEYIYLDKYDIDRHRLYHYTRKNIGIQAERRFYFGSLTFMRNQIESYLTGLRLCLVAFAKETALYIMGAETKGE